MQLALRRQKWANAALLEHQCLPIARYLKLLVVEGVVGNEPSVSKFFDLAMMVLPGGMERTEEEYRQLFQGAGFRLTRIVQTTTWVSVIEGEIR
jgi:hypothetical protein